MQDRDFNQRYADETMRQFSEDTEVQYKLERIESLMEEIDEKVNEFVELTGTKGIAVKQKWRAVKKQAGVRSKK